MLNTSVMGINSTSVHIFSIFLCSNGFYVGFVICNVAMSLYFFLGTPAHCWFLWFTLRDGWKIKPTKMFNVNLTIFQLIFSVQCGVYVLISNIAALRKMSLIVFGLGWISRPLMQVCICVEQYLAVIHPVIFLKYKGIQYRIVIAAVVWLMAAGYAVYEAYADNFPDPIFNSVFFVSIIIILFCCVSVLRALKLPGPGDTQIPVERGRDVGNQQKRNAFNTIFTGLLIILFSYLPQVSLSLINVIKIDEELFYCNLVPIMTAFILGVMFSPLLKMYKNGGKKFLKCQRRIIEN